MKLSDGAASLMSALLGVGLAMGLAYGGHILLGEPEAEPSFSPVPQASPDTTGDDICALMDDMVAYMEDLEEGPAGDDFAYEGGDPNDPEMLAALHESGQALIDGMKAVAEYMREGADMATDAEAVQAFLDLADASEEMGQVLGMAAVEAETLDGYMAAVMAAAADPSYSEMMAKGDTASPIVEQYIADTCGRNILGGGASIDTSLMADVSTLGKEIATYFVDWDGVTLPEITESDGTYLLNGSLVAMQTEGVVLSDQWMVDEVNWCVEVASEDDPTLVYSYSAQASLSEDTCESLRP